MSGSEALDEARALAEAQRRGLPHTTGHADVFMDGAVWAFAEQAATIQSMRDALEAVRDWGLRDDNPMDEQARVTALITAALAAGEALDEARRELFWKLQGARSHMQGMRESAEAFAVYDDLIRAEQAATIQSMRDALEAVRREAGRAFVRAPSGPEALALGNIRHVADAALAAGEHQEGRE